MKLGFMVIILGTALTALSTASALGAEWMWARGALHTHTTNSDGDSSPQAVADWYKDHGYQFLFITDHEKLTDPTRLDADPNDSFILIPGEELAMPGPGPFIHANALGISRAIASPSRSVTNGRSVRRLVDFIRDSGAIPMVNHPNWYYALDHEDLLHIGGSYLLEIANMGSGCQNAGDHAHLSTEQMWDILLSSGQEVYATATDDMHKIADGPIGPDGPGKGWVVVRVRKLTPEAVLAALAQGDFYSSTGVELAEYNFDGKEFRVQVVPRKEISYEVRFTGRWSRILQETRGTSARYVVSGEHEPHDYIRCKVVGSDGTVAWTQAYRLK